MYVNCKPLLDEVFAIHGIIKVEVTVIKVEVTVTATYRLFTNLLAD